MRQSRPVMALSAAVLLETGGRAGDPATRPLRLLLAEGDPSRALMLRGALDGHGHAIVAASTWDDTLRTLARQPLDAALIGLHLPGVGGLDAARRLRACPPPVNALTLVALHAGHTRVQQSDWRAAGFDALLVTPQDLPGIATTLRDLVVRMTPADPLDPEIRAALRADHDPAALAARDRAALLAAGQGMADLRRAGDAGAAVAAADAIAAACRSIGALAAAEAADAAGRDFPRGQDVLMTALAAAGSAIRFAGRARR